MVAAPRGIGARVLVGGATGNGQRGGAGVEAEEGSPLQKTRLGPIRVLSRSFALSIQHDTHFWRARSFSPFTLLASLGYPRLLAGE